MYIRAREKAIGLNDIVSGWMSAGLMPVAPMKVLEEFPLQDAKEDKTPCTPPLQSHCDLSLLDSTHPCGTETRTANALLSSTL